MCLHDHYTYCRSTLSQHIHISTYRVDKKPLNQLLVTANPLRTLRTAYKAHIRFIE